MSPSDNRCLTPSPAQERLWFLHQLDGSAGHAVAGALRVLGPLDARSLQLALNRVARRHPVLRARFPEMNGKPVQIDGPSPDWAVTDLSDLPAAHSGAEAKARALAAAQQPFDLAQGPLVRLHLLRTDEEAHVLVTIMHRIIGDESALDAFFAELARCYRNQSEDQPPRAAASLRGADRVPLEHLPYWREWLGHGAHVLDLPADRPRPARQSHKGGHRSFVLSTTLSAALRLLAEREQVGLFTALLAGFLVLLYRYSGQAEITVGIPVPDLDRPETQWFAGKRTNLLPLRIELSGDLNFSALLRRVRSAVDAQRDHRLPFETLVDMLQPERDLSRTPWFQAAFEMRDAAAPIVLTHCVVEEFEFETGNARYDLSLAVAEHAQELRCVFEFNTDLFDAERIARMEGHFQTLLEGATTAPGQSICTLPMLTAAERNQLLTEWNPRAQPPSQASAEKKFIHEWFEAQAQRTPEAIAVIVPSTVEGRRDETLSYQELDARTNQLAHSLQRLGVAPDVLVAICLERSMELIVATLGVLKAGGVCVPMDPNYPPARLALMLKDAGVFLALTQEHLRKRLPDEMNSLCLESGWEAIGRESAERPVSGLTVNNLAFVFHTSGSTGRPKAVMRPHDALEDRRAWLAEQYQVGAGDRHLLKSSPGFTVIGPETFWPLCTGGSVVIAKPGGEHDSAYLIRLIVEHRIAVLHLVPSLLRMLLEDPGFAHCDSLKHITCVGEALSPELKDRLFSALDVELTIFYGTTEAPSATEYRCRRGDRQRVVIIGCAAENRQVYILDPHLQPLPIGIAGEIYAGGADLARGYLNQPGLTAERFIANPFSFEPGARIYRTGDLARFLADGNIEFLGRLDHQISLRGFRIEPAEIEAILTLHPDVEEAVVLAREDVPGDKRLVVYVVPSAESAYDETEESLVAVLRQRLKAALPDYMLPAAFVLLDVLPLTASGKLDRESLPKPASSRRDLRASYVAPRTPNEETIAAIWTEVLQLDHIGIHDNFFDLGGHSLIATQVISRARTAFHIELPLRALFEQPTIAGFNDAIVRGQMNKVDLDELMRMLADAEDVEADQIEVNAAAPN